MTPGSPVRSNVQGEATRMRLMAVAEQLFAERGISAVSLREIATAARQGNNAAIQYHFGNKEGLLRAIRVDRGRVNDERRAAMLADAVSRPSGYDAIDLVEAMVRPLSSHLKRGDHYVAFLARLLEERGGFEDLGGDVPGAMPMIPELLKRRHPEIPGALMRHRFDAALVSMVDSLARFQRLLNSERLDVPADVLVEDLIVVLAAGLVAPPRLDVDRAGWATPDRATQPAGPTIFLPAADKSTRGRDRRTGWRERDGHARGSA